MIGTNVTVDGSAEYEFINKILSIAEEKYFAKNRTEEAKNVRKIAEHISNGGQGSYKLIEKKYEKPMREALRDSKIPFTVIYDNNENAAFVIRDIDADAFTKVQHDVFSKYTDYYAQVKTEDLCRIAKNNGDKEVVKLSFQTKEDFYEAQTKLYSSGVVCSVDKENLTLYVNSADLYSSKGEDLVAFELEWATNQAMNDSLFGGDPENNQDSELQIIRNIQATHDMEMVKAFSTAVQTGKDMVMVNAKNSSKTYMESGIDGLHIRKQDANGIWNDTAYFSKEDIAKLGDEGVGAIVSKFAFEIKDKIVIDAKDKSSVLNATKEAAYEWSKAWANEKDATGNIIKVNEDFARQLRPEKLLEGRDLEADNLKKTEIKKVTAAVEKEARRRCEAKKTSTMTPLQVRNLYKDEAKAILREKELMEIKIFINSENPYFSAEEKKQWIDNIEKHLSNEQEKIIHELNITKVNIKELEKQLKEKEAEKVAEKQATKEETQEMPKEQE